MKSLMSVAPGGPETLELIEQETPAPGKGEVLLRIKVAACNFPDTLIIRDLYQFKPERPFAPGNEVAGEIEAVGEGVSHLKPGDKVFSLLSGSGAYATHAVEQAARCIPVPAGMTEEDAAALMMTYGTTYYGLKDRGELKEGESLFITGASGGVGSAAIELGKAMGAKVIAGVSSEEKAAFCKECGADETIVYPQEMDKDAQRALSNDIKAATGGNGADVVYDAVGGAYAEPCVRAMAWGGRFLVIGFPAGIPAVPLNLTLLKSCQIVGVFWGASVMREPALHDGNMKDLLALYKDGKIKPRITARFPLEEGAKALEMLEQRKATGKIILTMD